MKKTVKTIARKDKCYNDMNCSGNGKNAKHCYHYFFVTFFLLLLFFRVCSTFWLGLQDYAPVYKMRPGT